jgi:hypothetical protein
MDKDTLKEALKKGLVEVTFTKLNGDTRVMTCTLNEDIVPPATKEDPLTQKKVRAVNEEVQVVYDVEKSGWRSFRWDSFVSARVD